MAREKENYTSRKINLKTELVLIHSPMNSVGNQLNNKEGV